MSVNRVYCGDSLFVMRHDLLESGVKVDLIYLDPPFFTGKVQKGKWQPGAMEVSFEDSKKFWSKQRIGLAYYPEWMKEIAVKRPEFASYLYYMQERLKLCRRVLKSTGSIYLHCNYRASHYLKLVMDKIFGVENFQNEIVWGYRIQGVGKKRWARKHDTLLFYTKGKAWTFNPQKERIYYRKSFYNPKIDKEGRFYRDVYIRNIWDDINALISISKELLGYPTQKPLALLERIIKASSNPMDIVLDPFCGCGTAIVSAHKLGRRWLGIDISPDACMVMQKRFEMEFSLKPKIHWRNLQKVNELDSSEFESWVNEFYAAKKPSPDKGVDGITPEGIPIQTKTHIVKYNVVSAFLNNFRYHPKVPKPVKYARIVSQKGFDDSAVARAFEIEKGEGVKIELVTPKQMLSQGDKLT